MSQVIVVGGGDGIGGMISAFSTAHFIRERCHYVEVKISASDSVYNPLYYLFRDKFHMEQLPIEYSQNHRLVNDKDLYTRLKGSCDYLEYICPDTVNAFFDYKRYNILPNTIKSLRLLTHKFEPSNQIYLALNTTTANYNYQYSHHLIRGLAYVLPDFKIHVPILDKWSDLQVKEIGLPDSIPENVIIHKNPNFIEQLDILSKCIACIAVDCGTSHIFYHYGGLRILLDPHINDFAWILRWREDMSDSIPLDTPPGNVVKLLYNNIHYPETQLLSKREVLDIVRGENWKNPEWKSRLILKY